MEHLPRIICRSVSRNEQRYNTIGDYYEDGEGWTFDVLKMTADYEFMVIIHEMIEWYLTQRRGLSEEAIATFDKNFKEEQSRGEHADVDEPGEAPDCPYKDEHFFAANIERMIADKLGADWKEYDRAQSPGSPFRA